MSQRILAHRTEAHRIAGSKGEVKGLREDLIKMIGIKISMVTSTEAMSKAMSKGDQGPFIGLIVNGNIETISFEIIRREIWSKYKQII